MNRLQVKCLGVKPRGICLVPLVKRLEALDCLTEVRVEARLAVRDDREVVDRLAGGPDAFDGFADGLGDLFGREELEAVTAGGGRRTELAVDAGVGTRLRWDGIDPKAPAESSRRDGSVCEVHGESYRSRPP